MEIWELHWVPQMLSRWAIQPLKLHIVCDKKGCCHICLNLLWTQLPTQDQLKTVFDKVKDFFGDAKESFGKISSLNPGTDEETEGSPDEKAK